MPVSKQKQVLAGLDKLAGRALGQASSVYRREVVTPLVARLKKGKSLKGLLRQLGPGLVREMKTARFEDRVAAVMTQSALIGVTSATPRPLKGKSLAVSAITDSDFSPKTFDAAEHVFRKKVALTSDAFDKLSAANKSRAFRIAGVHKAKLVQRARDIVKKAIADGTGYADVRRELLALFDTEGIPAPALHRLRTMFSQNVLGAYGAARTEKLREADIVSAFPFWQYLTVGNGKPGVNGVRATHAALHGKVLRADDPFWDRFDPPWEWGCRCFKRPLTPAQLKRLRVKVIDDKYVKTKLRVPGQTKRGIDPNPSFGFDETQFDLTKLDAEIRRVVEEMTQ